MPLVPDQKGGKVLDIQSKRTLILTMKNISDIIDLDTKKAYDAKYDEEGTFIQHQSDERSPIKVLRMHKQSGDMKMYKFTYCDIKGEDNVTNLISIDVTFGEIRQI